MVKRGYITSLGTKRKLSLISMDLRPWKLQDGTSGFSNRGPTNFRARFKTQVSEMTRRQTHRKCIFSYRNIQVQPFKTMFNDRNKITS